MGEEEVGTIVVAGAGPVGCLTALLLAQDASKQIIVVEKRADPRQEAAAAAAGGKSLSLKSINLALSDRGRAALRKVGLEEAVLAEAVEMTGRLVHLNQGRTEVYQEYDDVNGEKSIYSVSREAVTNLLRDALFEKSNVCLEFDTRVVKIDQCDDANQVSVTLRTQGAGEKDKIVACQALFGCDGTYSSVREAMSRITCLDFHRTYIEMGYSELVVPSGESCAGLRVNVLHIWPKEAEHGMMMIALPNNDGSFTATLFAPFTTLLSLQRDGPRAFRSFLEQHFSECLSFLQLEGMTCKAHPLFTSTVSPWNAGSALLLGDAAHAQVPFFGQGMNAGLEDALEFYEMHQNSQQKSWREVMSAFDLKRRPCGDAITILSLENYVEMHTSSSQWWFRVSRRIQGAMSHILPAFMVSLPLYYQVAFTRRPYHEILREKRASAWWVLTGSLAMVTVAAAATGALVAVAKQQGRN